MKVFNKYFQSFQNKTTKQPLEQKKNKDNVEPEIAWKVKTGIQGGFSTVLGVHKTLAAQMTLMAPVTLMALMAPMNLVALMGPVSLMVPMALIALVAQCP